MIRAFRIPVGEARELEGKERHEALVEHFGMEDSRTQPLPLDELPALPTLEPTMFDMLMERMGPRRRRGVGSPA